MKYYVVDAFAEKVFEGNPAGVCVLDKPLSEDLMQKIAIENNLSETAFAVKVSDGYDLRWYTPGGEVDLCGHATLATAFIITKFVDTNADKILFHSMSGDLTVSKEFPLIDQMVEALGVRPLETYLNRDLVFVLENEEMVQNFEPNLSKLEHLPDGMGVLITAKGNKYDFVSRTFFPKIKVPEDPVCGSAHSNFIPYWAKRLGKDEMVARQLSKRGGTLYCKNKGNRVSISGHASLYSIAEIFPE